MVIHWLVNWLLVCYCTGDSLLLLQHCLAWPGGYGRGACFWMQQWTGAFFVPFTADLETGPEAVEEGHTAVLELLCTSSLLLLPLHRGCWGAHYASLCLLQLTFGLGLLGLKANAVLDPTISFSMCHVKHYIWIEMMTCPHMFWSRVSSLTADLVILHKRGSSKGPLPFLMSQSAVAWLYSPTSLQVLQGNPPISPFLWPLLARQVMVGHGPSKII